MLHFDEGRGSLPELARIEVKGIAKEGRRIINDKKFANGKKRSRRVECVQGIELTKKKRRRKIRTTKKVHKTTRVIFSENHRQSPCI